VKAISNILGQLARVCQPGRGSTPLRAQRSGHFRQG
jgi:hypothetical protein